jgi:hypothetical protein
LDLTMPRLDPAAHMAATCWQAPLARLIIAASLLSATLLILLAPLS